MLDKLNRTLARLFRQLGNQHLSKGTILSDCHVAAPCEPLVTPLPNVGMEELFRKVAHLPHTVFFDSAQTHDHLGRYSFLAVDPFDWFELPVGAPAPFEYLQQQVKKYRLLAVEGLPPWQGGAAGVISYDCGQSLERLPKPRFDEFSFPALAVGLYDLVMTFDNKKEQGWVISQGLPEIDPKRRKERAQNRTEWLLDLLKNDAQSTATIPNSEAMPEERLAPCFEVRDVLSNFSRDTYLQAIRNVIAHLRAGDAFQVNLAQRLLLPAPDCPVERYLSLRENNAAPFGGYLSGSRWHLLSASPERFIKLESGEVETRPIKGTCPRGSTSSEDYELGEQLIHSEKDRAENVMIVDLLRNDLSRVCTDSSVKVPTLFGLERYAHVQHLVSVVEGDLREECDAADLLKAVFPGGSITGAPKIRSQEIIAEQEPSARGAYCGSLFYLSHPDERGQQAMDSSILIRTMTLSNGWLQAPVGGGITVASDPEQEYEETWHKARGLIEP